MPSKHRRKNKDKEITVRNRNLIIALLLATATVAAAQTVSVRRGGCTPGSAQDGTALQGTSASRAAVPRRLPTIITDWDPAREYRQAVVLLSFTDQDFGMERPQQTYDSIFNYRGFNKGRGPGCVADYFRDQSGGLFNLVFDVFGPYQVNTKAQPYDKPTDKTYNNGQEAVRQALRQWIADQPGLDYSVYDWNGNGRVNQVILIAAGPAGNESAKESYGYIWPNTNSISSITTPDGRRISDYSVSCERTTSGSLWGIGTVCHEFSHSLGLPDIYPTTDATTYSIVDQWDLMDGGNFTNNGWCPPNYTALERWLMGWSTPEELTGPVTITDMKSVSDGGRTYIVRHTDNEYLMLENRQWSGWDYRLPGRGLVITHVDYSAMQWYYNNVNNTPGHRRYDIVHADGLDYGAWEKIVGNDNPYVSGHCRILSTSAYPYYAEDSTVVNDRLTGDSSPAAVMFNANADGHKHLSQDITNISMTADGLVSFDLAAYDVATITRPAIDSRDGASYDRVVTQVFDLRGRSLGNSLQSQLPGIYIIRYADGTARKVVRR